MRLDDAFADRQPQPGAAAAPAARGLGAEEALEQARQLLVAHARGTVVQIDQHLPAFAPRLQTQRAAGIGIAAAVLEQVGEQLAQPPRIAEGRQRLGRQLQLQRQATVTQPLAEGAGCVVDDLAQVQLCLAVRQCADIGQRQLVQVVDQLVQGLDLGLERAQRRPVEPAHAVFQGFQLAVQHAQRRAQLVRHIRHELAPHRLVALQGQRELVEVVCQAPDLVVAAALGHARVVVARGQLVRGLGHLAHRPQQPARSPQGHRRGQQHGAATHQPAGSRLCVGEALLGAGAGRLEGRQYQPADGESVDHDAALDGVRRRGCEADDAPVVRVQQREAARRPGQFGRCRRGRWALGQGHPIVLGQRPQQPVPEFRPLAQEIPAAVLAVARRDAGHGQFEAVHRLLVQVAEEVAVEVDVRAHAHRHGHHHRRAQHGGKQAGGEVQIHGRPAAGSVGVHDRAAPRRGRRRKAAARPGASSSLHIVGARCLACPMLFLITFGS